MPFPHAKLTDPAYLVTKAPASLFDGTATATFTLGTWPSGRTGRLKITISSVTGHTDCAGSIAAGSETLTFTQAGTKTTTVNLTANPVTTSTGLDCHVHITVIGVGGADILTETLTAIDIKYKDETKYFSQAIGGFVVRPAHCTTDETASVVGDVIRYAGVDHVIKAIHTTDDRHGLEIKRKLEF
ncbi:hypothetical protein M0R72_16975 [Candidatus Pacearchaeota archaeon]|jgi:hypothetical protein|nr:hypothetical protein [Candidatus Pacearchaeota archaeon]